MLRIALLKCLINGHTNIDGWKGCAQQFYIGYKVRDVLGHDVREDTPKILRMGNLTRKRNRYSMPLIQSELANSPFVSIAFF